MNKCYYRIFWKNYPDDSTPLNDIDLNRGDVAIDEIDNRVIALDAAKFNKSEAQLLIKYIEYDEDTGIFKITHYNGASYTIDTMLEKLAINFDYDYQTQRLIIELSDGTVKYVDLSALITQYEFLDSDTVYFTISADGKVTADIKDGSIQEKHLQPNYLSDIKVEVAKAEAAATAADASKTAAAGYASTAATKAGEAAVSADNAANSATAAEASKIKAAESASIATDKANSASGFADNAEDSKDAAATYANNAANSANIATEKASDAEVSADSASTSATSADTYAKKSQSYAVGTGGEVRENDDTDCAEHYYEQAKRISQSISGVIPMGTISFAGLDNPDNQKSGYLFNISDSFTSDDRFVDGGGRFYGAGSNVMYTADGKWDVLAATMVSGVKGDAETEYRQGFVNITKANIGLGNVNNTADADKVVKSAGTATKASQDGSGNDIASTYLTKTGDSANNTVNFTSGDNNNPTAWVNVSTLASGEKHSSILNKVSTMFRNVRYIWQLIGNTQLSVGDGTITGAVNTVNAKFSWVHKDLDQHFPSSKSLTITLSEISNARECIVRIGATSASYTVSSCDISVQQNAVKFGFQSPTSSLYFIGYVYRNGKDKITAAIYDINGFAASDIALLSIDYRY